MKEMFSIDYVMDMLKVLADNPYSALWNLVEDFTFNGHIVSVQRSTQYKHIIIDNVYRSIGDHVTIVSNGNEYSSLEYVKEILLQEA